MLAIALRLEKWHLLSRKDKNGQFVYTVDHVNENPFDCRVSNLEVLRGAGFGRGGWQDRAESDTTAPVAF